MLEINVKEARSGFSKLLNKVEQGQEIILTRRGKKVACIVSLKEECSRLPSLKKFRQSIRIHGNHLSDAVLEGRDEERY